MHIFELNHDVLIAIFSIISRSGLLCFARTCRAGYSKSMPQIISTVHIGNRDYGDEVEQLRGFCKFILADHSRILLLRHLTMTHQDLNFLQHSDLKLLSGVFEGATRLEYLSMARPELYLLAAPSISTSLINCPRLRDLSFENVGQVTGEMIRHLRGLRKLQIPLHMNTLAIIQQSQPTLEILLSSFGNMDYLQLDGFGAWRNVRDLKIPMAARMTGDLYSAFPNVRDLMVIGSPRTQAQHTSSPSERWSQLDIATGTLQALVAVGLPSSLRELRCITVLTYQGMEDLEKDYPHSVDLFLRLVQKVKPSTLSFGIDLKSTTIDAEFFVRLAKSARDLNYLGISVPAHTGSRVFADLINKLEAFQIADVPLYYVSLLVFGDKFETETLSAEWKLMTEHIIISVPSVQYVDLTCGPSSFEKSNPHGRTYWRVQMAVGESAKRLVPISEEHGLNAKKCYSKVFCLWD